MIIIKSDEEIDLMRISGKVTGTILKELETFIKPGISTEDIDRFVETTIRDHGMIPTFKGYGGFPASACVSINEEVVHGIPSRDRIIQEGDIVSVDVGSTYKVGYRLSDISHAIQKSAEGEGFSVIRDFVGHGVGQQMHEDPQIPNYGRPGRGPKLKNGMVIAIEPMISMGTYEVEVLDDEWTAVTTDGKYAAHYENTVVITDGEPEVITLLEE